MNHYTPPQPQLTEYLHTESALAAGTTYAPPAKTIIMGAMLSVADKLEVLYSTYILQTPQTGNNGVIGALKCEGASVRFKNTDVAAKVLTVWGVSMT
ncbi:unnamed protein product [marine sediment metagenome]|uniref:Uncharacterized protein n=1 Tax=marine sediment metagenome TaxID=412755 RepID=X1N2Z3_9ZZZZ